MRILTVSDKVEPVLYGPYIKERVGKVDLVLACGDLPYYYLEYIIGLLNVPLYFVHGNHDRAVARPVQVLDDIPVDPPPATLSWGANLHTRTTAHGDLLLAGFEGCRTYNPGAPFQYTEPEVQRQALTLAWRLLRNRFQHGRYLDVLITHAPPRGIHDAEDVPHQGFETYLAVLRRFRPLLMIHGHTHVYNRNNATTETDYEGTRIVNTYGYRVIELARQPDRGGWRVASMSR